MPCKWVYMLHPTKKRAYFCKSIVIEMGRVSRYFPKISGSRGRCNSPEGKSLMRIEKDNCLSGEDSAFLIRFTYATDRSEMHG